ncbi:MAG TPA: LLM class flavin-dependent oxidoreductase [Acidimicrobiales bacterium]|nr:LLM class flavin-dependent oxidoreductase [Acidimicrobiales bacterium]
MRFGVMFDFRNPPEMRRADETVYRETLETVRFVEELGFDDVWLSEHHFTPDGYCPSPLAVSAAIAAQTSRVAIGQALMVLPLHDPLRVAEDGATVDVISGGRFLLGVGVGYRPKEFEGFGIDIRSRGSRMEEQLAIIDQAWRTGAVTFHGRHFDVDEIEIRPRPVQRPRPPIWIGGLSRPAIARAALLGDGLLAGGRRAVRWYVEELERLGRPTDDIQAAGAHRWYFVDPDPDRLRDRVEEHLLVFHNTVVGYFDSGGQAMPMGAEPATSAADLEAKGGQYVFCTPEECARQIVAHRREVPLSRFYILGGLPGLDFDIARGWIETFARVVVPAVRSELDATVDG